MKGGLVLEYNSLYSTHDCHKWHDLFPEEQHYITYKPHIIYSMNKVDDVYYAFSNARFNGYMTENNDYGDMITVKDSLHLNMVHSNFLMNALNFYCFAIDLSWQVIYFYSTDSSYYFLCDQKEYDKFSNTCTYDNVVRILKYRKKNTLLEILKAFSTNELVLELRNLYNYMKHKGTIHFKGLGIQYSDPMFRFKIDNEDITFKLFTKRGQRIEELKSKLIEFDKLFFKYFEDLLEEIVPDGYLNSQIDFNNYLNVAMEIKNFKENHFNDYKNNFKEFYSEIIEH